MTLQVALPRPYARGRGAATRIPRPPALGASIAVRRASQRVVVACVASQPSRRLEKSKTSGSKIGTPLGKAIDALEQEIRDGDARLGDPMFYAQRADEVGAWMEALDARRAKLEVMMTRWEELEKRRDVKK